MQETQAHSLGREDPLEKAIATHSSISAWRIPWTEEPGGLQAMWVQSMDWQRVRHDQVTNTLGPANHTMLAKASRLIRPLQRREGLQMRCCGWIPP